MGRYRRADGIKLQQELRGFFPTARLIVRIVHAISPLVQKIAVKLSPMTPGLGTELPTIFQNDGVRTKRGRATGFFFNRAPAVTLSMDRLALTDDKRSSKIGDVQRTAGIRHG